MAQNDRRYTLSRLLTEASGAHRQYEIQSLNGVYDQQWAGWYARYLLQHDWNEYFVRNWEPDELAAALGEVDREYRANKPDRTWQDYYGEYFATHA